MSALNEFSLLFEAIDETDMDSSQKMIVLYEAHEMLTKYRKLNNDAKYMARIVQKLYQPHGNNIAEDYITPKRIS